ncbi:MAG: acyl-CoA dehydrogenase [Gammaproteobacteria bacterium]
MNERIVELAISDDETQNIFAASVRRYCEKSLPKERLRTLRENDKDFDNACWQEMVEAGWAALAIPEHKGGLGFGLESTAIVNYELGRVAAAEPILETATLAASLLSKSSNADTYLGKLIEHGAVMSGPVSAELGLKTHRVQTDTVCTAVADEAGYRLNGVVMHVPIARQAQYFLVPAKLDSQVQIFVLDADADGVKVENIRLADSTTDGRVTLENVVCDETAKLTFDIDVNDALANQTIHMAAGAASNLLGLSDALLSQTVEYLQVREQFGRPIGSFQSLQHRVVDWYLQLRLCAAAIRELIDAAQDQTLTSIHIVRALNRACAAVRLSARESIQMHGAIGFTLQYDLALLTQRALVLASRYGASNLAPGVPDTSAPMEVTEEQPGSDIDENLEPPGGDWNALDDADFRATLRTWINNYYPAALRHYPGQVRWDAIKDWHQALLERGWVAPAWPREHGGMALAPNKLLIYIEEMERHGVARAPDQGIVMVGPVLMKYGTDDQRARYLEPSRRGEFIWCQGYSEPNAGSDLASLTTSAKLDGDEFVINGHKIWTTHGLDATHMYCLVRTDFDVKPQAGISFVLIDLDQAGIEITPIPNLSGDVDFCEVFLTDVRVPAANLVGKLNQGWTIAKALLGHERLFVGSPKLCRHALSQLQELAARTGLDQDPVFADQLRTITYDIFDLEALYTEFADAVKRGETPGADVAILKIGVTETYTELSEIMLAAAGKAGGVVGPSNFNGEAIDVLSHYYNARPAPIYAGSNEIQRNIIAKQVLGLPTV